MLFHQIFEALESYDLAQRSIHSIGSGFCTENSCGFINEPGIDAYGDYCH
jgi:hypothetical protein